MREILFRGKKESTGDWVFGDLRHYRSGKVGIHSDVLRYTLLVDPETVGQYTGLRDCKHTAEYPEGQKIFEGDIIQIPDDYDEYGHNAGEIYEIYFCCGGFRLKPKHSEERGYWLADDRTVEVIGNIHDNPELLKEGGE